MTPVLKDYYGKSIRIAPDGFSFYKRDGKQLRFKKFPHSSSALISTEAPLFFDAGDPVAVVAARHVPMLVPAELYSPEKDRDYLDLQFDTSRLGRTFTDTVGAYQAVYFLNQNELDTLDRLPFPYQVVSETALAFRMLEDLGSAASLHIGHNNGFVDVAVLHKNEPLLANRFPLSAPTDILYYLLNIIRQLSLHTPDVLLQFHDEEDKKLLQLLKSFKIKPIILES